MLQRIQTLYMLAAVVACMVCLSTCVGHLVGGDLLGAADIYNLWILMPDGNHTFQVWALFVLLVLTATLSFIAIFLYKKRTLQMRLCTFSILLSVGWYGVYAVFAYLLAQQFNAAFRVHWAASLPFAAIVLLILAWRGILKDEKLVRSLDRLR